MRLHARTPLVVGAAALSALAIATTLELAPRIVWNATPSAPMGFYLINEFSPKIGDYVLVEPSITAKRIIDERLYLPPDTLLIKRIAALPGAKFCRENEKIIVNTVLVANALKVDSLGRPMPQWNGCFTLQADELFLLNQHERSLDGRYFGATKKSQIIGVARPIFVREASE